MDSLARQLDEKMSIGESINSKGNKRINFETYWTLNEVIRGLMNKKIVKSQIMISKINYRKAYVSDTIESDKDIYIEDIKYRNRALDGDIVAARLKEKFHWKILDEYKEEVSAAEI